jgi:hypothetical protein
MADPKPYNLAMEKQQAPPPPEMPEVQEEPQEIETPEEIISEDTQDSIKPQIPMQPAQAKPQESDADRNFRALREQRDAAIKRADEIEQWYKQQTAPKPEPEEDLEFNPDEFADGKHLNKVSKELKKVKEELRQTREQSQKQMIDISIKSRFPDYEKVVSDSNIALFKEKFPAIAYSISMVPNYEAQAVAAYEAIKNMGVHVEDTFVNERAIAQKNAAKPRPLTSISPQQGDTPLSRVNAFTNDRQLTEDMQKQYHKEMMEAIKNR